MHLFFVLSVIFIWGVNFAAVKVAVDQVPPVFSAALRFTFAALLFVWFARPGREQFPTLIALGLVLGCCHFGLMFVGLSGADVAVAAVAMQLGIPFSVVLARIWLGERFGFWRAFGMALAFLGVIVLMGEPETASASPYVLSVVVSAFCWAVANILLKRIEGLNVLGMSGWVALLAAPVLFGLSFLIEDNQVNAVLGADWRFWAGISFAVVFSTGLAYGLWFFLMKHHPVSHIVPFGLLVPAIGMASGALLLGEALTIYKILGGLITLAGVGIIQYRMTRTSKAREKHVESR
ncbi:MAG: DMT family transporter [Magnetovibrionaceae bacterium]